MEQSSLEHEKQLEHASEEKKKVEGEKDSLREELERLREEARGLPKREELEKYVMCVGHWVV